MAERKSDGSTGHCAIYARSTANSFQSIGQYFKGRVTFSLRRIRKTEIKAAWAISLAAILFAALGMPSSALAGSDETNRWDTCTPKRGMGRSDPPHAA